MPKSNIHIDDLKDYLAGKLDGKAMHAIEKQALEDPFLAEALEGLMESPDQSIAGLETLKAGLEERVAHRSQSGEQTIRRGIRYWWYGVAALFVLGVGLYTMTQWNSDMNETGNNITQEIVRGVDQPPSRGQGVLPDSGTGQDETNADGLVIRDSVSGGHPAHPATETAEKKDRIASGKVKSQLIEGDTTSRMVKSQKAADELDIDSNTLASNINGQPNPINPISPASPVNRMAFNQRKAIQKKSASPEIIPGKPNDQLAMHQRERRSHNDTSQAVADEYNNQPQDMLAGKVAGIDIQDQPKPSAKSNPSLNDGAIVGNADGPGKDTGEDDINLADLVKEPDLVRQKSRLRPAIEMKAYTTYINAEVARLRSTQELNPSLKGAVLFKFLIPDNGVGKPTHISIEYSSSKQLDRIAKKLLAEGPDWEVIPGTQAPYWGWYTVVFK